MRKNKNHIHPDDDLQEGLSFWAILGVASGICVILCIVGIIVSYLIVGKGTNTHETAELRGLFGDSWGGVNALISALAFAGVIATLFLQNADLKLQRKEMKEQRKEFEKENETLKYQRFENLFYNMMTLQQRIVDDLKVEYDVEEFATVPLPTGGQGYENRKAHRELTGREVFRYIFEDEPFLIRVKPGQEFKTRGLRNVLHFKGLKAYDEFWSPTVFDHYFRHMYKILQFIDSQDFPFEESYRYVSLLRGTLSRHELVWVYYNALQPHHYKLKAFVEKYSLLKNIRPELLSLSLEADKYYKGLGLDEKDLRDNKFSSRDFEFYLTNDPAENKKYQLSAFWNAKDIDKGKQFLASWNDYIDGKASKVIEAEPNVLIK